MPAGRDAPFVQLDLVPSDPRRAPFGIGRQPLQRLAHEIEGGPVHRHRVLHPHHELDVERPLQPPVLRHLRRLEDVGEIEGFDLGLDVIGPHLARQPVDQVGRVLVDAGGEVVRPHGQRRHVGPQGQHAAARLARARPPAGRELDDHAGAVLFQPLLQPRETLGVRCRRLVLHPDMGVDDRGPRLERLLRAFHLFGNGNRHRRVVFLARQGSGDRDADDAGSGHGAPFGNLDVPQPCARARQRSTARHPGREGHRLAAVSPRPRRIRRS